MPGAAQVQAARIRWLCRRGMKELDVLLERFYQAEFARMDAADRCVLQRFLENEDPTLYAILIGGADPDRVDQALLAARIRACRPPVSL